MAPRTVDDCCGTVHTLTPAAALLYDEIVSDTGGGFTPVPKPGGGHWMVPLCWILLHGLDGADIATTAGLLGWPTTD